MKSQSPFPPPCWKHFTGTSAQLQAAQQLQTHNPVKRGAGLGARTPGLPEARPLTPTLGLMSCFLRLTHC